MKLMLPHATRIYFVLDEQANNKEISILALQSIECHV
jgi:hypothetical protein